MQAYLHRVQLQEFLILQRAPCFRGCHTYYPREVDAHLQQIVP